MPNCQPGDLAKVVHPDSYGSIVLVEEQIPDAFLRGQPIVAWRCLCMSRVLATDIHKSEQRWVEPGKRVYIRDTALRPLPKPPEEDTPDPVVAPIDNEETV